MVLSKRKRDGEFVTWTPNSAAPELPDTKKARTVSSSSSSIPCTSALHIDSTSNSSKQQVPKMSYDASNLALSPYTSSFAAQSTSTRPGPSQPQKSLKSHKNQSDSDASKPEKRGARFKSSCPQNIMDRVERVMSQRFFMIDRQRVQGELKETFSVLGSTGNVYTVVVDHKPSCNCPDALKGNHCKHILFIYLKVLQVSQSSNVWYQKALLTSELETIFADAPLAPNSIAHPRIREVHARATGKDIPTEPCTDAQTSEKKRIPGPEDDCPICYEAMHGVSETSLAFCAKCGNGIHKQCFEQWKLSSMKGSGKLTCVYCRAPWASASASVASGSGAHMSRDGYLNLAGVSGVCLVRDTSTYYRGPRRGYRRNYYDEYDD